MYCQLVSIPADLAHEITTGTLTAIRQMGKQVLDLDQAWPGLHYVLSAEPRITREEALRLDITWNDEGYENIFMGGQPMLREQGFASRRFLSPDLVRVLDQKLQKVTMEKFIDWYEPEDLSEESVPPDNWWDVGGDKHDCLLIPYYRKLKDFFRDASAAGLGIAVLYLR